jgi:hypothetical protein
MILLLASRIDYLGASKARTGEQPTLLATQVMCNNVSKELRNILSLMDEMGLAAETGLKFREESQIRIKIAETFSKGRRFSI